MKKIFLIILLSSSGLFSQTIDDLKKADTIYFYFSQNDAQIKKSFSSSNHMSYTYYKNDTEYVGFRYVKFKDFDMMDAGVETYKKYHDRRFLQENKDKIIDINFLNEVSLNKSEIKNILYGKKFFLIDEEEMTNGKILIREIFMNMLDVDTCEGTDEIEVFTVQDTAPFYYEMQYKEEFYTLLKPKKANGSENLYVLFKPSKNTNKSLYKYVTLNGAEASDPKIEEKYTFKLQIKDREVFLQLTNKRKQKMELSKKYDLFDGTHRTISVEDLNNLSEKQLEDIFLSVKNIYIVEDFQNTGFVTPKLVKVSTELNDFIRKYPN